MQIRELLLFVLLTIGSIGNLYSQELTPEEEVEMREKFWGNKDVALGAKASRIGNKKEAADYYYRAVKTFEAEKNWEAYIRTVAVIAQTNVTEENHQEIIDFNWAAREKIKKEAPDFEKFSIRLYHNIGTIYNDFGKPDLAMATYKEELSLLQEYYKNDFHLDFVLCYNYLGNQYRSRNDLDSSLYYFLKAETVIQEIYDTTSSSHNLHVRSNIIRWALYCYKDLLRVYRSKGNFELSLEYAKKGLAFAIEQYGQNSDQLFSSYGEVGYSYIKLGEYEKSAEYYKKALFVIENNNTDSEGSNKANQLADVYGWLGYIYNCLNQDEEALAYQWKELEIIEKENLGIRERVNALNGMGRAYMGKRRS